MILMWLFIVYGRWVILKQKVRLALLFQFRPTAYWLEVADEASLELYRALDEGKTDWAKP